MRFTKRLLVIKCIIMIKILRFFLPIIILCLFCSLLNGWVPITERTWLILPMGVLLVYVNYPIFLETKQHVYCAFYIFIVFFFFFVAGITSHVSNIVDVVIEYCVLAFPASLIMMLCKRKDTDLNNRILITFTIIIFIAAVGTVIAERIMPGAVRLTAPGEIDNPALIHSLKRMGMSNYGLPHAIPVVIPAIIVGLKTKSLSTRLRTILFLVLIASLTIVFYSGATTAILVSLLAIIISMITRTGYSLRLNLGRLLPIIILTVVFLLFSKSIGRTCISIGAGMVSEEGVGFEVGTRLQELGEYLLYDDEGNDMGQRTDRYEISLNSFFSNPLVGGGSAGGHSAIFDLLGRYGILGFLPWLLFLASMIAFTKQYINPSYVVFYYEGILMSVLMLLFKNMASRDMWFFVYVLLPLLLIQLQDTSIKRKYKNTSVL